MRQIKIREITLPGKTDYIKFNMYCVFLGNDSRNYFSNRKDAKQFLVDTNRFLNIRLHEFNQVYASVFSVYQRNWFYFDSNNGKANLDLSKMETKIIENFHAIPKAMITMVRRSQSPNGNYLVFTDFFHCIANSLEIIESLTDVFKERKHYVEIKCLEILKGQLEGIHKALNRYGKEESSLENLPEMEFIG